jgi:hypothetical protein
MIRRRRLSFRVLAVLCCGSAAAACAPHGPPSPHAVLGADAEPLRSAFNADVGKVRVIMLVAPT